MYKHLCAFILFLAAMMPFLPALQGDYLKWDDGKHVVNQPAIFGQWPQALQEIFTQTINGTYIPLTTLSFSIEYHLFGFNPVISHAINLLLHGLVCLFIFYLLLKWPLSLPIAFFSSLLFAWHPMHTESVSWVTERKDVLYALFFIIGLHHYHDYLHASQKKSLVYTLIFATLSILAKPMAVSFPLICSIMDWWYQRRFHPRQLIEKALLFLIPFGFSLITIWRLSPHPPIFWPDSLLIAVWSLSYYLIKFIWPYPLLPVYTPIEPVSLSHPTYIISILVLIFILILWMISAHQRLWRLAILWWFASIFIFIRVNFADINIVADRFMYLPCLFFCVAFVNSLWQWPSLKFRQWIFGSTLALILLPCAWASWQLSRIWQNDLSLWHHVLKHEPHNTFAHKKIRNLLFNDDDKPLDIATVNQLKYKEQPTANSWNTLGLLYVQAGHEDLALHAFKQAIALDPQESQSYVNLASLYSWTGNKDQALNYIEKALRLNPQNPHALLNRAILLKNTPRFKEAIENANTLIRLQPQNPDGYLRLGDIYLSLQWWPLAVDSLSQALNLSKKNAQAYYDRGMAFKALNHWNDAIIDLKQAIHLNPKQVDWFNDLAVLYLLSKQIDEALMTLNQALILDPFEDKSYANRANVWIKKNDYTRAMHDINLAIRYNPKPGRYLITRGDLWMVQREFTRAMKDYERAAMASPQETLPLFQWARAAYENGQFDLALSLIKRILILDPEDDNAKTAQRTILEKQSKHP